MLLECVRTSLAQMIQGWIPISRSFTFVKSAKVPLSMLHKSQRLAWDITGASSSPPRTPWLTYLHQSVYILPCFPSYVLCHSHVYLFIFLKNKVLFWGCIFM